MKKYIYAIGMIFTALSCEPQYSHLEYKDQPFLSFLSPTASVSEGNAATGNALKLSVGRATSDLSQSVTVSFVITSAKFTNGADATGTFSISGAGGNATSVVIPAGKGSADITLTTVGNTVKEDNRVISLTLTSATSSDFTIGMPGSAANNKSVTVTIADDDCVPNIGQLLGAFDCFEPNYGTYPCNFSQINCSTLQNDNFWDAGGVKINYTINALAGTVSIANQTFGTRSVSGTGGTLNLTTGRMVVPYTVKNAAGANEDVNTHTFTRK